MRLDFTGVQSFTAIPEGKYNAVVFSNEIKDTKAGDSQYVSWQFSIIDGKYKNRRLFAITSLKQQALFKLKEMVEAINPKWKLEGAVELDFTKLQGKKCVILVGKKMYEGQEQNEILKVFPFVKSEDDIEVDDEENEDIDTSEDDEEGLPD